MKTKTKIKKFDASEFLDSEEMIAEYLDAILHENDTSLFLSAIGDIAKARGMKQIADKTGLGRESLYKAFSQDSKPRWDTVFKVIKALGVDLTCTPPSKAA